jgi:hypothetical protein
MGKFKVQDRVCHRMKNDPNGNVGFGTILEIEGARAKLRWEDNGREDGVEVGDLITEEQAELEGLV